MFIVLEAQTNVDGRLGTLINQYDTYAEAESKYYTVLAAAVISSLPKHAVFLLGNDGIFYRGECYNHELDSTEE